MLERMGLEFTVVCPDIDETPRSGEDPASYVERLARGKAMAVVAPADAVVIAADTTVDVDGEILGKPEDAADARRMLKRLSGRTHHCHSGVAVRVGDGLESAVADTLVHFEPITDAAIDWYLATGEPFDKAGAYALQGAGGVFITKVTGSVSNVIGLPLPLLVQVARRLRIDLLAPRTAQPPD
jgi:septum formation protein